MSNKFRIRNTKGDDLIVIDLHTGEVHSDIPNRLIYPKVAEFFWRCVQTAYTAAHADSGKSYKDLILKSTGVGGEHDGDIIFQPGQGVKGGKGGDVTVETEAEIDANKKEPCPECGGNPKGVLLAQHYSPCKTCGNG